MCCFVNLASLLFSKLSTIQTVPLKNRQRCSSSISNPKWLHNSFWFASAQALQGNFELSLQFTLRWLNSPWAPCEFGCEYINISVLPCVQPVCESEIVQLARWRKREEKLINQWLAYAPAILISSHWGNNTARRNRSSTVFAESCARQYEEHAGNDAVTMEMMT